MKRYLIDAHALLWHRNADSRLSHEARAILSGESGIPVISDAILWEITVKHSLGKLTLVGGPQSLYQEWIVAEAAQSLPIAWKHIEKTGHLPFIHRDPFDRLLVAQAITEGLTLVTADPNIPQYPGVRVRW